MTTALTINHDAIETFMGTIDGQTLGEALLNAERDCRSYGWSRLTARTLGRRIRAHFARVWAKDDGSSLESDLAASLQVVRAHQEGGGR